MDHRDDVHQVGKSVEMRPSKMLRRVEQTVSVVKFPPTTSTRVLCAATTPLDDALYEEMVPK
jgi:hypothetical protein